MTRSPTRGSISQADEKERRHTHEKIIKDGTSSHVPGKQFKDFLSCFANHRLRLLREQKQNKTATTPQAGGFNCITEPCNS